MISHWYVCVFVVLVQVTTLIVRVLVTCALVLYCIVGDFKGLISGCFLNVTVVI